MNEGNNKSQINKRGKYMETAVSKDKTGKRILTGGSSTALCDFSSGDMGIKVNLPS